MVDEIKNPSDQKPVSLEPPKDIENLLKELPKIDSLPPAAPLLKPPIAPQTTPPLLKATEGMAKPQMPPPPKPISPPPAPQSVKSFVRTMAEDLEAAKKGIKPEPKPFEIKPPPSLSKAAPAPEPFKMPAPQIKLGPAEKTKPLELPKIGPAPLTGPPAARKFALSPKNLILILIIIAAVFAGAWYFLTREGEEVMVPTPIITQTPTPIPTPKTLSELIRPSFSQTVIPSNQDFLTALNKEINLLTLIAGKLTSPGLIDENGTRYSLSQIFQKLNITPPNELLDNLDVGEWDIAVYGQNEIFDSKGLLNFNQTPKPKIVLVAKIIDPINVRSALNSWEVTMTNDLKNLFNLDSKKATSETFLDNIYSGTDIRYRNFPFADSTIDYAIVNLPKFNADYFILAGSRESIYSAIDLLQLQ